MDVVLKSSTIRLCFFRKWPSLYTLSDRLDRFMYDIHRTTEWVSEWVSEWASESVSEGVREGRGSSRSDTELINELLGGSPLVASD